MEFLFRGHALPGNPFWNTPRGDMIFPAEAAGIAFLRPRRKGTPHASFKTPENASIEPPASLQSGIVLAVNDLDRDNVALIGADRLGHRMRCAISASLIGIAILRGPATAANEHVRPLAAIDARAGELRLSAAESK